MMCGAEGSPQIVRGPERGTWGALLSVAAPDSCFEATLP
jgi:hypothetical protein